MFTVIELQTNKDKQTGVLTYTYDTEAEAMSKYYLILSSAAVSSVAVHGAVMMDDHCIPLRFEAFEHGEVTEQ